MKSDISNYDLFSLIETALSEDTQTNYVSGADDRWVEVAKGQGIHAPPESKKKQKINQSNVKDEDFDIIEDDEDETEDDEDEKPEPTTIDLNNAIVYEKFVDDLNMFRAAHSFSDKTIKTELTAYFDSLTREEKQVLHILVKGLIHVTMMDVKGKSAKKPSDFNLDIRKSGVTSNEKRKSLDKKIELEKQGKKVDNNTPIKAPIKIGESRQNKNDVLRVLNSNIL
jgi:hypothetical protein